MAVSGKYKTRFSRELLWQTLLSSDAICYAIPELVRLERIDTEADEAHSETMRWRGEGFFPGSASAASVSNGTARMTTAIVTAGNLNPYQGYTLQFESEIGHKWVQAAATITLTAEAFEPAQSGQDGLSPTGADGTLIRWEAEIHDTSGRPHAVFEWMAGLAAQHFFRRIDLYLKNSPHK